VTSEAVPLTAIVLTLNEAELLPRCLTYLDWADEVLVVDSGSADSTTSIASEYGARVIDQPFLGWSAQRNLGASQARNDWVMFIEADEVVTRELQQSVRAALAGNPDPRDGFYMVRATEFLGRMLPSNQSKKRVRSFVRLYNRKYSQYDTAMAVHEEVILSGARRALAGELLHWRRQDSEELVGRMNRYATVEASVLASRGVKVGPLRLIALPIARLAWLLIIKGEIRLGMRGLVHAGLRAMADFTRLARVWESSIGPQPVHPPGYGPLPPRT
jgi:glycosyltransferase involved in cell wall biosynthesis